MGVLAFQVSLFFFYFCTLLIFFLFCCWVFIFIDLKAVKEKVKDKEEPTERPGQSECKVPIIVIMVFTQLSLRVMIITGI